LDRASNYHVRFLIQKREEYLKQTGKKHNAANSRSSKKEERKIGPATSKRGKFEAERQQKNSSEFTVQQGRSAVGHLGEPENEQLQRISV